MAHSNNSRLLVVGRRRKILELLKHSGQVTIHQLVKRFAVSSVTVRADLDTLSATGALRFHGGAVRYEATRDYPLNVSHPLSFWESRIGKAAAQLVWPDETISLDSGTTTAEIVNTWKTHGGKLLWLRVRSISPTNWQMHGNVAKYAGGLWRTRSLSFVRPQAEMMLRDLQADRLFLVVDGFTLEHGAFTSDRSKPKSRR